MKALVNIDGKISPPEDAKVSVFDRGFLFGDGVYETGVSYNRCFLFLEEHLKRLRRSAQKLFLSVPWTDDELTERLNETARAFQKSDLYFRLIVTRGPIGHVGLDVASDKGPTLVVIIQDLPTSTEKYYQSGVHLVTSKVIRNSPLAQDPNIKTSNYLNSFLAMQDAKGRGGDDAIMCDGDGNVTEGTTFALFGVTGEKVLITSSLEVGILDSITRRHVIGVAKPFLDVSEDFIKLSVFQECPEVFIASSVRQIMPVGRWDEKTFSTPGPITKKLQKTFKEEIQSFIQSHPKF